MSVPICTPIGRRRWSGNRYLQATKEGGVFMGYDDRGTRNPEYYIGTYWPPERVKEFLAFVNKGETAVPK